MSILKKIILLLLLFLIVTCDNLNFIDNKYYNKDIDIVLKDALNSIEVVDSYIDQDYLYLPKNVDDLEIVWYGSSNPEILSNSGKVSRPGISQGESRITINARCSYGAYSATRDFEFVISPNGGHEEILNIIGCDLKLIYIEPGKLDDSNIVLTEPFYISESVISRSLYNGVMGIMEAEDEPVSSITYEEVLDFCHRLSTITGKKFFIPTEAQLLFTQESLLLNGDLKEWTCDAVGDLSDIVENPYNKVYPGDEIVILDVDGNRSSINYYDKIDDLGFRVLLLY